MTASTMAVPILVIRSASHCGTRPPCKGRSAVPDFLIALCIPRISLSAPYMCHSRVSRFTRTLTRGLHCSIVRPILQISAPELRKTFQVTGKVATNDDSIVALLRTSRRGLETFLARQRERDRELPAFVEREFRSFLDCGVLVKGFIRL